MLQSVTTRNNTDSRVLIGNRIAPERSFAKVAEHEAHHAYVLCNLHGPPGQQINPVYPFAVYH